MKALNIFLWASMVWIPALLYAILKNECTFKKNIAVGVTFPGEVHDNEEIHLCLAKFAKSEKRVCAALILIGCIGMFLPVSFGLSMTLLLIWMDFVIAAPYFPYVRCNRELKSLKDRLGLTNTAAKTVTVDLSAAGFLPVKELSVFHFLLPFLISLVPCIYEILYGNRIWGLVLLINSACIILCWLCYRFVFRRKSERVDENAALTETLTRLRHIYWRRMWLYTSWFIVLLTLFLWGAHRFPMLGIIGTAVVTILFTALVLHMEFQLRHNQEKLTAAATVGMPVDEDEHWPWGLFYYNPNDSKLFVNQRTGGNVTFNLARPAGKVITGILAATLLLMPLMGVWVLCEENTPVTLTLEDNVLHSTHFGTSYEISLDEIDSVTLLSEKPRISRIAGTGMDTVQKGRYTSSEYGDLTVCIDPREGPWVLVRTTDGTLYLLGGGNSEVIAELLKIVQ